MVRGEPGTQAKGNTKWRNSEIKMIQNFVSSYRGIHILSQHQIGT